MFLLLILLQAERRLSPAVIIGAVLVFIAGVSLLVYFYRRYRRVEKESEDDWDSSRHSLFANIAPPATKLEETAKSVSGDIAASAHEEVSVPAGGTREFAADLNLPSFATEATTEPEPQLEPQVEAQPEAPAVEAPIQPQAVPPVPEPRQTEILASPSQASETLARSEPKQDAGAFDDEVWAGLDVAEPPTNAPVPPVISTSAAEPPSAARVEQPSYREPFEPPRIDRISRHEPYEAPTIEPLKPREAVGTGELRSAQTPSIAPRDESTEARPPLGTVRFGTTPEPRPLEQPQVWGETRKLGETVSATPGRLPEPAVPAGAATRVQRTGTILGLPAERSQQPMILGEPVRPAEEVGIGALTNYGRDVGPKGGRSGTVALLVVVLLLGGAIALYLLVPSVHSRVGAFVARVRGTPQSEDALRPRAQVIPSTRPEVNKNMVTARGAVDNISDEPLENLAVEVSLQRGGGESPEIRTVPVSPNPLPARERGTFEFEYDGKRDTGFLGYTITRLFSNGTEVRFRAPGQK